MLLHFLIFVIFITTVISCSSEKESTKTKLLFKSSFEEGVYIDEAEKRDSTVWWQNIEGSDDSNFSWPIELKGELGSIQMIVSSDKDINNYINNRIERVEGIDGKFTKALHQIIKKKDNEITQAPYVIYTNDQEQKTLYIKYSLKFPKNLSERLGEDGWLTFCEYKTKYDNRLAFYIYSDENKKLYWYLHSDNVSSEENYKKYKEYWFRENREIKVPQGEWFNVELFWNRDSNNSRVWWAVNGKTIADYHGSLKIDEPIHEIMFFTNYSNNPIDQWVDNIEIWDNFPCGKGKSCYKQQGDIK